MRCATCSSDKGKGSFNNSQLKKPAGERRCKACAAAAATTAGGSTGPAALAHSVSVGGGGGAAAAVAPVDGASSAPAASAGEVETDASAAAAATTQTCTWATCGAALSGEAAAKNRCGRCKKVYYCSRRCQKRDWKAGGHKKACEEPPCCTICLDGGDEPLPLQRGCACRGDAGLAHVACQAQAAAHKGAGGWNLAWAQCPTCGQRYMGAMRLGLAREAVRRLEKRALEDGGNLLAARVNLGQALNEAGDLAEAEALLRDVLAIGRRAYGRTNPATRDTARNLADVMRRQGHHAEAAALYREILAATPAKEQEDNSTLVTKANLAATLSDMGDHAEAEALLRGVQATQERLYGPADARTLTTAVQLGVALHTQGKHAEVEAVYRPTLAAQRRVLGPEHPHTLTTAHNLAGCLYHQGQHAEAVELLQGALAVEQRTNGLGHADTLRAASLLAMVQEAASTQ